MKTRMTDNTLYRTNGPIRTLDPVQTTTSSAERVVSQLYETLFEYDYADDGSITTSPHLVAEREEATGVTRRYRLRQDVTFTNGDRLTAEDVAYTLERAAASEASIRADLLLNVAGISHQHEGGEYVPGSLGVRAVDDRMIEIEIVEPFHGLEGVLADVRFSILPAGLVDDVPGVDGDLSQETFARSPHGTGPFSLETFDPDHEWSPTAKEAQHWIPPTDDPEEELVLRARDDYREQCSLDGIHYWVEDVKRRHELAHQGKSEQFYLRHEYVRPDLFSVDHVDDMGRRYGTYGPMPDSGLTADHLAVPYPRTNLLVFNTDRVPRLVRRAVAYILSQESLVAGPRNGRADPATFITPPGLFPGGQEGYDRRREEVYPFDMTGRRVEAASEMLSNLKDTPFELSLEGEPYREATCEWLASEFDDVAIDAEYREVTFDELQERQAEATVDASLVAYDMDYDAPENFLQAVVPDEDVLHTNWAGTDAAMRASKGWERLQANRGTGGETARHKALFEIQEAILEDVPIVPLYYSVGERFTQQWNSFPPFGPASRHRQRLHQVEIGDRPNIE